MATERTLSIIKPDATRRNLTGKINAKFEDAGLRIVAQKRIHLSPAQAGKFYEVHKDRPFYGELVEFMTSGPVVVQVLEGEDAVKRNRDIMLCLDVSGSMAVTDQAILRSFADIVGGFQGERIGSGTHLWKFSEAVKAGEMTQDEFLEAEQAMSRSSGTCNTMGTASTMASMVSVLMVKPKAAMIPKVPRSTTGTAMVGMIVARKFCRNRNITRNTSTMASSRVWITFSMATSTKREVS